MMLLASEIEAIVDRALAEDLSTGDPTTEALIPPDLKGKGKIVARAEGILAGVGVALAVFQRVDPQLQVRVLIPDGSLLKPHDVKVGVEGDVIAEVAGRVRSILQAERTALNFLQHLSGVATEVSRYVRAIAGYKARILDTRKTIPGLRALEKYAVTVGGGTNHRRNLGDGVLIKDNHIWALRGSGMTLSEIVDKARANTPHVMKVEVEVEDVDQVREALDACADILLLDNMELGQMRQAVEMARGRAITEASGGIDLRNVEAVASTGVDFISVGALTHSARALDISLDLV